jgi:hypothetical protein
MRELSAYCMTMFGVGCEESEVPLSGLQVSHIGGQCFVGLGLANLEIVYFRQYGISFLNPH